MNDISQSDAGLRRMALAAAEAHILQAVSILYPICGEQVTMAVLQQMAEEQSRLATMQPLLTAKAPSQARN